jgi:hypothetical protein
MPVPCPYAVLGLLPTVDPVVLEAAIRALRLKYHPDKVGGSQDAFRKIERAAVACREGLPLARDPSENEALRERIRDAFGPLRRRKK